MKKKQKHNQLLKLTNVRYSFESDSGKKKEILKNINFTLRENDFIGITGQSGAGKTILLKIIAGLITPTKGRISTLKNPPKISVVFEDASLFPWLDVEENIQLGLRSSYLSKKAEDNKVEEVIDLIGLGDHAKSYPKELSAGMKQRVNFARALVSEPDILLMDDPFVSLDILTAESLRNDLFDFLNQNIINIKATVIVTHNIHDIMKLCKSVFVMKHSPTELYSSIKIDLPFPRNANSRKYNKVLETIYNDLSEKLNYSSEGKKISIYKTYLKLSDIHPSSLHGFLDILIKRYDGHSDVSALTKELSILYKQMFLIAEFATMLNFIKLKNGKISITAFGRMMSEKTTPEEQQIFFGKQLTKEVPIIKHLHGHTSRGLEKFHTILEDALTKKQAAKAAEILISWGKFGKIR